MISCGCDPGANGSITIVNMEDKTYECLPLKKGSKVVNQFLIDNSVDVYYSTIEEIVPRTGWGIKSMCSLYGSYKSCEQAMSLLDCTLKHVKAREWQKSFNLIVKNEDFESESKKNTFKKNLHKTTAKELVTALCLTGPNITHNNADSLLIALYRLKLEKFDFEL